MKICPKCGKAVSYNSYFGAYICGYCYWEDATIGERRNKGLKIYRMKGTSRKVNFSRNKELVETV